MQGGIIKNRGACTFIGLRILPPFPLKKKKKRMILCCWLIQFSTLLTQVFYGFCCVGCSSSCWVLDLHKTRLDLPILFLSWCEAEHTAVNEWLNVTKIQWFKMIVLLFVFLFWSRSKFMCCVILWQKQMSPLSILCVQIAFLMMGFKLTCVLVL